MILYRFDDTERFALLESVTTAPGRVTLEVLSLAGRSCLRIRHQPGADQGSGSEGRPVCQAAEPARIAVALPLVAIGGDPELLVLDVHGDASGCEIALEATDASMRLLRYSFGAVDFAGWRTCQADLRKPVDWQASQGPNGTTVVEPPIQFFQLCLTIPDMCRAVDLCLASVAVTGRTRVVPSGLAGGSG